MSKPLILTTPKGKAEWPHLVEPDVALILKVYFILN